MKNASYKSCTLEAVQKSNESDDQTVVKVVVKVRKM